MIHRQPSIGWASRLATGPLFDWGAMMLLGIGVLLGLSMIPAFPEGGFVAQDKGGPVMAALADSGRDTGQDVEIATQRATLETIRAEIIALRASINEVRTDVALVKQLQQVRAICLTCKARQWLGSTTRT